MKRALLLYLMLFGAGCLVAQNPTIASLSATGTVIKSYDASSGGNLSGVGSALTTGTYTTEAVDINQLPPIQVLQTATRQ